jgi:hypothetical protein
MGLFKPFTVESVTEINTTPEKIWDFFLNIEKSYKRWHPECHNHFHWKKESLYIFTFTLN